MRKQIVVAAMIGAAIGSISAYGSMIIIGNAITKQNKKDDETKQEVILDKMKMKLAGTDSETLIDKYTSIINNARNIFDYDYDIILKHIDHILDSKKDPKLISSSIETYFTALDIFHDAHATVTEEDNTVSSEDMTFLEDVCVTK